METTSKTLTRTKASITGASAGNVDGYVITAMLVLVCCLPFLLSDQPTSLNSAQQSGLTSPEGDVRKQLILSLLYVAGVVLLWARTRIWESVRCLGVPMLTLLLIAFASALWSELAGLVIRRSVALAGTMALGVYAAMRLDEDQISECLVRSALVSMLLSFAVAAIFPAAGLDPEGRLRGVFAHKNMLGSFAALGFLSVAAYLQRDWDRRWPIGIFTAGLCATALLAANSASPIPVLALGLFGFWLSRRSTLPRRVMPSAFLILVILVGILLPLLAQDFAVVSALFGRGAEFSGRTQVWQFSIEYLRRDPWLGYGFGAFWNSTPGMVFLRWTGAAVVHAHNGYVQLALDFGLIGFFSFACAVVVLVGRLRRLAGCDGSFGHAFAFGYLTFFFATSLTEVRLLGGNEVMTMLFVFILVRASLRIRLQPVASEADIRRVRPLSRQGTQA